MQAVELPVLALAGQLRAREMQAAHVPRQVPQAGRVGALREGQVGAATAVSGDGVGDGALGKFAHEPSLRP